MKQKISKNINKKGEVPIVLLVVGVFLTCLIIIGSFFIFQNKVVKVIFLGAEVIEQAVAVEERYFFYKNSGQFSDSEIEEILNIRTDEYGNKFVYLERFDKGKRTLSVKYFLP